MSILLRNPVSGQVKRLPQGWSWACFLGVGLLGGPLFRRGLPLWGAIMVSVNVLAIAAGKVKPVVFATYPLAEAEAAHRAFETGTHVGKILLTVAAAPEPPAAELMKPAAAAAATSGPPPGRPAPSPDSGSG